jgi:uncharacterized protein YeaO (DUF488 family)
MKGKRITIRLKRAYDAPEKADGRRILVDRLWPRGLSREKAGVDVWAKDIAPSTALRRWYGHDPHRWAEFRRRYAAELDGNPDQVEQLLQELQPGVTTFLYSSKETQRNNAVALQEYLESVMQGQDG